MSIDTRARDAVAELHGSVAGRVPALAAVEGRHRLRRAIRNAAVASVVAAVVVVGLGLGNRLSSHPVPRPVATPSPTPSAAVTFGLGCAMPGVTCSADRISVGAPLAFPVSFAPIPGLDTDNLSPGRNNLEVRTSPESSLPLAGMAILEQPTPVDGGRESYVPELAGANAQRVALWLSERAFLRPTTPSRVDVGGHEAWRVVATLRDGADLPSFYGTNRAALTFVADRGEGVAAASAVEPELRTAYYYVLDLPGRGLVVVWIWTRGGGQEDLDRMDTMIAGLRFD